MNYSSDSDNSAYFSDITDDRTEMLIYHNNIISEKYKYNNKNMSDNKLDKYLQIHTRRHTDNSSDYLSQFSTTATEKSDDTLIQEALDKLNDDRFTDEELKSFAESKVAHQNSSYFRSYCFELFDMKYVKSGHKYWTCGYPFYDRKDDKPRWKCLYPKCPANPSIGHTYNSTAITDHLDKAHQVKTENSLIKKENKRRQQTIDDAYKNKNEREAKRTKRLQAAAFAIKTASAFRIFENSYYRTMCNPLPGLDNYNNKAFKHDAVEIYETYTENIAKELKEIKKSLGNYIIMY